jgi:transcriptional regulator with XRE-family HTH domain
MTERAAFGLELQRARERSGLSLDDLAACTKISASLFAGLERGDLSRWPAGIFRRAFVRNYAQAVGLDPEETVARFLRVHPDAADEARVPPAVCEAPPEPVEEAPALRLVLDQVPQVSASTARGRTLRRVGAPLVDLALAGVPGIAAGLVFGWAWFWIVAGAIGLVGHMLLFSLAGTTPGGWLLLPRHSRPTAVADLTMQPRRHPEAEVATTPATRRRQARHSGPRPVAAARSRRIQH